jgi:hypothetical protein
MSSERIEQVDLHRPRRSGGDQRRPTSGLRRNEPQRAPSTNVGAEEAPRAKPQRRTRVRDWLSR